MAIKLKCILLVMLPIVATSCYKQPNKNLSSNQPEINRRRYYTLLLDSIKSNRWSNQKREWYLPYDSIFMQYYADDSILFVRYWKGQYAQIHFFAEGGQFMEDRGRFEGPDRFADCRIQGIDSVVTFSKKDTVFLYKSTFLPGPLIKDYFYLDCQYTIKKVGDHYMTKIQSAIDTTYKEIFFYDKDYNVFQYITTWKNYRHVYVRK